MKASEATAVATLAAVLALAAPAQAKKIVYSPVVLEGEKEVAYYVDWREGADGRDVVGHELEFEYGLGPRDQVALYGVWEAVSGGDTEFANAKLEWIHPFFEQGQRAWDFGTYLEYQIVRDGPDNLEFKPLLEKTLPRTTLTLNGVLEKQVQDWSDKALEVGYAARWAWRGWAEAVPALELHGDLGEVDDLKDWPETSQLLGPVVDLRLGRHVKWQVGSLFGLTQDSEDVRVKTQIAVEWF